MSTVHISGQTLTVDDLTAANIVGAATGYAARKVTGVVNVRSILDQNTYFMTLGEGIPLLVTFDGDVPTAEIDAARYAAFQGAGRLES